MKPSTKISIALFFLRPLAWLVALQVRRPSRRELERTIKYLRDDVAREHELRMSAVSRLAHYQVLAEIERQSANYWRGHILNIKAERLPDRPLSDPSGTVRAFYFGVTASLDLIALCKQEQNKRGGNKFFIRNLAEEVTRSILGFFSADAVHGGYWKEALLPGMKSHPVDDAIAHGPLADGYREAAIAAMVDATKTQHSCFPVCPGCKNEIDPEVCHCGVSENNHYPMECGHNFVPAGCTCGYAKQP